MKSNFLTRRDTLKTLSKFLACISFVNLIACDDDDTSTSTQGGTMSGTPAGSQGGTPAGSQGGTPAGSQGGTPAGSQGGTPAGSEGGTPAGSEGGTPAGSQGGTPAGSQGGTPAGSEGGTPAGSQGGTPAGMTGGMQNQANWDDLVSALESQYANSMPPIHTMENAGTDINGASLSGKEAKHVPYLIQTASGYTLSVGAVDNRHVQTETHWISHVYIKNQDGRVVYYKELTPADADAGGLCPVLNIESLEGTSFTAYELCNLHEIWASSVVESWESKVARKEAQYANSMPPVHTMDNAGTDINGASLAGKEVKHVPVITADNANWIISVGPVDNRHAQTDTHWISEIWLRNQDQKIVYYKELTPADQDNGLCPILTIPALVGTTSVTPYEICNLHELWRGSPLSI